MLAVEGTDTQKTPELIECTTANRAAQLASDRCGAGIVTVGRDPVRDNPGHHSGGTEERFGGGEIASLAKHHVHQGAVAVNGPI
jgi:hypothetical protein